jgi:two-component system, OmpR family, phosphate regulon response regulator PhoB
MLTHATSSSFSAADARVPRAAAQTVLIVNGDSDVLEVLEPVLDAGNYDVVFVESTAHAYSQIRRVQPDLVILCVRIDEPEGFQVLSMLKLDAETRNIPVVTYTSQFEPDDKDSDLDDDDDEAPAVFGSRPVGLMN